MLYPNVLGSCQPYEQFNRYRLYRWHHEAYRRRGTGCNIWCRSASAFCQTGDNNGKSWNSPSCLYQREIQPGQPRMLLPQGAARKRRRGRWDVRVRFPKQWWRIGLRRDRMWCWRDFIFRRRGEFSLRKSFSLRKKYSLQEQNFVLLNFLSFRCYGNMGSPSPFAFVCFCSRRMFLSENFHSSNGNNIPRNDAMKQFKAIKTVGVILGVYIVSWMPSLVLSAVHCYYTATNHLCNDIKLENVV